MNAVFSALTVYFLYAMSSVPFIVWAGRSAHSGTVSSGSLRPWPGILSTIMRVVLPLLLIFLYAWNVFDAAQPGVSEAEMAMPSEWMPYQFLLLPPAFGSIAGYGIGFLMGAKARNKET
ncbi:hypothetical protein HB779_04885 [Phyllobacterium sp. 628]|uniref:hypothetical protein n=1 Tax=Phyllobacterium sp. 628 TaxID=2718938 RepID=UPI0016623886|nr:hypothetical protein [Phyllobacterium sp. 628]QND51304.1 hypothetical protein HB779_04885 [Phyllobacterium sp. 628]